MRERELGKRRRQGLLVGLLAAMLLAAGGGGVAHARSAVQEILKRCGDGQSLAGFTVKQYREALRAVTTDGIEYEECAEIIFEEEREAARRGGHGSGKNLGGRGASGGSEGTSGPGGGAGGGAGGAGTPLASEPTQEEQKAVAQAQSSPPAALHVGSQQGAPLRPGVVRASVGSAFSSLPTPLLAALAALAVLVVGPALAFLRQRLQAPDEEV